MKSKDEHSISWSQVSAFRLIRITWFIGVTSSGFTQPGWLSPVILWDGRVVGIWSYNRPEPRFQAELFEKLPRRILDEIDAERERLARFTEGSS